MSTNKMPKSNEILENAMLTLGFYKYQNQSIML